MGEAGSKQATRWWLRSLFGYLHIQLLGKTYRQPQLCTYSFPVQWQITTRFHMHILVISSCCLTSAVEQFSQQFTKDRNDKKREVVEWTTLQGHSVRLHTRNRICTHYHLERCVSWFQQHIFFEHASTTGEESPPANTHTHTLQHNEALVGVLYFNQPINLEQSRTKHLAFANRAATFQW